MANEPAKIENRNYMFSTLKINDWKHINKIEIDFHPKLTIITGANGSGKSTIIRILARHFGWGLNEYGTPARNESTGGISYHTRRLIQSALKFLGKTEQELGQQIGSLTYDQGKAVSLNVPSAQNSPTYQIEIPGQRSIKGLFIPAHRPPFVASSIQHISTRVKTKAEAFGEIHSSSMNVFGGGGSNGGRHIKDTLLNWIFHGYGNKAFQATNSYRLLFEEFQAKMKDILPAAIGFQSFEARESEIVLICDSGDIPFDACSGGITSLIDLTWQIFTFDAGADPFVVVIDEVENHLHPSMQRSVLSTLIKAFPRAQFIVTTHSPFVVGSAKDSSVYAFQFGSDSRVFSQKLELVDKAATASEILKEVLGVPLTIPIWAEEEISGILRRFENEEVSAESVKRLTAELRHNKLDHLVATSLGQFIDQKKAGK